jgi:ABC-type glycerol-3-phosphate transport system substrate-binding protein
MWGQRFGTVLLVSLALLALVSAVGYAAPTVIRFVDWSANDSIDRIIAAFEEVNPDIQVRHERIEWRGTNYLETLVVWLAGGMLPDLIAITPDMLPSLVEAGALMNIDQFLARDGRAIRADDFYPVTLQNSQWNGKQYGLPTVLDVWVVNINRDTFALAGVEQPSDLCARNAWTWEAMETAARKTTRKGPDGRTVQWGMWTFPGDAGLYPFLWAFGGDLLNPARTASVIGQPGAVNAISYMHKLMYEDGIFTFPDWYGMSIAAPWETTMANGDFGMQLWWSGLPSTYANMGAGWGYDQVPVPPGPVDPNTNYVKANSVVMSSQTKHAEAAWRFMTFLTGAETSVHKTQGSTSISPRQPHLSLWFERKMADGAQGTVFLGEGLTRGRIPPLHSRITDINKLVDSHLLPIWQNKAAVEPTLKELERQINAMIAGN